MKFTGSLEQLQQLLESLGVCCHWEHKGVFEVAVIEDGVSNLKMNWWPHSGDLRVVGDPAQREPFIQLLQSKLGDSAS